MASSAHRRSVLPGFRLSLGISLVYLAVVAVVPLSTLFFKSATMTGAAFWQTVTSDRVLASYRLSFGAAALSVAVNAVFGLIVAWVLVRYRMPGRRFADALVDVPLALPTAVAGIALTTLYASNGWIGSRLEPLGLKVAYTPLGIVIALVFIGLPFVVRTVQPVLEELDPDVEEAAASLGATRAQVFTRVILPQLLPAWLTGCALAFARTVGEYGSVVFISGNMPFRTEIAPLLIMTKLEQYDETGATAVAVVMLLASFAILGAVNLLQWWGTRRSAEPA
jgi:sulfate transport system permease protein